MWHNLKRFLARGQHGPYIGAAYTGTKRFRGMGSHYMGTDAAHPIEEPDVALRGMKAFGLAGKNLAIMAGWNPRIRGVRHEITCPSGRRIEYQMFGRCAKEDPVVLMFPGMFNANASRALAHCCGRYELPEESDGFPQSAALLFNRLTDGDDPRAEFDSLPLTFACVARPGYGKSTLDVFPWNFTYEMFAADMAAVADWLRAPRFAVMGASSGGPCALAVAHAFPRRVAACLVNCGDSNYRRGYPRNAHWFHGETAPATGYRAGIEWTAKIWLGVTCGYGTLTAGWVADMWMEGRPAAWHDGLESIACPVRLVRRGLDREERARRSIRRHPHGREAADAELAAEVQVVEVRVAVAPVDVRLGQRALAVRELRRQPLGRELAQRLADHGQVVVGRLQLLQGLSHAAVATGGVAVAHGGAERRAGAPGLDARLRRRRRRLAGEEQLVDAMLVRQRLQEGRRGRLRHAPGPTAITLARRRARRRNRLPRHEKYVARAAQTLAKCAQNQRKLDNS